MAQIVNTHSHKHAHPHKHADTHTPTHTHTAKHTPTLAEHILFYASRLAKIINKIEKVCAILKLLRSFSSKSMCVCEYVNVCLSVCECVSECVYFVGCSTEESDANKLMSWHRT